MRSIGMDVHRSFAQVAIHEDGITARSFRLELEHDAVVAFGKDLRADDEVVLEATGNTAAMSLPPEFGFHPSGEPNSGGRLIRILAEADRLEAGGLYPENGKSIPMVSLAIFSIHLCLSFGPEAHVSVQVVRKDGGSPNSTAVLQDQAPHGAVPRRCPAVCSAGQRLPFASGAKEPIRQAPPERNMPMPS